MAPNAITRPTPIQFSHQIHTILDQENFLIWKSQVLPVLKGYGLVGFIDGSKPSPDPFLTGANGTQTANPDFELWIQQDQLILAWILSSVSTSILTQVVNCETSADLWRKIQDIYSTQSIAKILDLKLQLQTSKKGGHSCNQYLQQMQTLADRLRSIGSVVSEHELVMYTLQGLGTDFDNFVTAVSMLEIPPSMAKLSSLLLAHEARIQSNLRSISNTAVHLTTNDHNQPQQAYYTNGASSRQSTGGRHNNNYRGRGRGNHRGRGRGRQQIASSQSTDTHCQICDKWGHSAIECYHRFDIRYTGPTSSLPPTSFNFSSSSGTPHQAMLAEPNPTPSASWFLDSGATTHVTADFNNLSSSQPYQGHEVVHIGNGMPLSISHVGCTTINTCVKPIKLTNILLVPAITKNLLSISQLIKDNNVIVEFSCQHCFIKDPQSNKIILSGTLHNGLYQLDTLSIGQHQAFHTSQETMDLWHYKLGHCSFSVLEKLKKTNVISVMSSAHSTCSNCNKSKAHKLPFDSVQTRATKPLEVVHSDLWGPSPVLSDRGNKYYVHFVDEYTRFSWIYPCACKSDVAKIFIVFKSKVENLLACKIQTMQCDGGTEYKPIMAQFPEITFQMSCPYTPEQNGLAERKHKHIVELGLATMFHASLPMKYWDYIFESMVFIINRLPSTANDLSPFEQLFKIKPDYKFLHVLGCACYPLLRPYTHNKLEPRSEKCAFLRYSQTHKGYYCLHISSNKIYTSRHVVFDDLDLPFTYYIDQNISQSMSQPIKANNLTILPSFNITSDVTTTMPSPACIATPVRPATCTQSTEAASTSTHAATHQMMTRNKTKNLKPKQYPNHQLYAISKYSPHQNMLPDPTTFNQAVKHSHWRKAMATELDALAKNATWHLVPLPSDSHAIGAKWIFKTKYKADGSIERHKARLVAKGFNQEEGIDYTETFSPVVKPTTIRIVLCIALSQSWSIHQLDVNNAFLNGDLQETVYLEQPPGFVDPLFPHHVCKLNKALYGLKQAPRAWFQKLRSFLHTQQFRDSQADPSLFIYKNNNNVIYLLVYVDDIIITGNNSHAISSLIKALDNQFSIKDLGHLNYFLGLEVTHHNSSLYLSQSRYLTSILERASMQNAKPCQTPMEAGLQLSKFSGSLMDNPQLYRSIVGALQYATITRPDIQFAVNKASQFMCQPTETHWQLVKRILRYLKGTLSHGMLIRPSSLTVNAYCDADWAGCPDDRRSTTGFAVYMGENLISWSSKKQSTVSRSSTEAEYRSMATTAAELTWLQSILTELGCTTSVPTMWCDNLGATFLASNPVFHARTKHIELDFHFVREKVVNKQLNVRFVCSADQIGDVFTKGLSKARYHHLRDKLNVFDNPLSLRGPVKDHKTEPMEVSSNTQMDSV
ncbi:hypothetical protein LUZ63_004348 [Rhynchospora breviuscula]|uniref:Integrase catalytic domain-containing protein n=1 Tax=Rhynchospora breviuscula TaxID=2022672 RepID=A0A9Q0D4P0_9POAL|nr:hypothetical protein LUZ63_004348 [Rhynchospora breviuscula]